jgi:hypothetical protein
MPYLVIIVPQVTEENKESLLGAWPMISKEMNALPNVVGVSGGQIVAQDGAPVTDFKFLQTIGMSSTPSASSPPPFQPSLQDLTPPSIRHARRRKIIRGLRMGTAAKSKIRSQGRWSPHQSPISSRRLPQRCGTEEIHPVFADFDK